MQRLKNTIEREYTSLPTEYAVKHRALSLSFVCHTFVPFLTQLSNPSLAEIGLYHHLSWWLGSGAVTNRPVGTCLARSHQPLKVAPLSTAAALVRLPPPAPETRLSSPRKWCYRKVCTEPSYDSYSFPMILRR